jgi:HD-GYP domain
MNDFSVLNTSQALVDLNKQFLLDKLDDWHTTAGLTESVITAITGRIPECSAHIFVHAPEAREYREIEREGLATIPEDSLFIACLAMQEAGIRLDDFFNDYILDDPLLHELLSSAYDGTFLFPVVHRFNLLAFILIGKHTPDESGRQFLTELSQRLKTNLYAASIADQRQRELLRLAEYPVALHRRHNIAELSQNLLEDLGAEIKFDYGIYYEYEEYLNQLIPVVWTGGGKAPPRLAMGTGISGQTAERRRALYVPDRSKHPSFSCMEEESFIQGSFVSAPIQTDKRLIGVITLGRDPDSQEAFGVEHRYTLEIAAAFIATEITNRLLYDELEQSYFSTVASLTRALEAKDLYTRGHSERVMTFAVGTAQTLKLSQDAIRRIRYAAILHDIGKIGVSDSIITKPTRLTDTEFAEIKRHTEIGYTIVNDAGFFSEIRDLIRYHHEKMDGTGYYAKRSGDYPWEAMIISMADIYDALTSNRPYRKAFDRKEALASLESLVGINFDQRIFSAFKTWIEQTTPCFEEKISPPAAKPVASIAAQKTSTRNGSHPR